ncbi:hypothetical protein GCM10010282_51530 [Streptomyces roseolus]|nr:hypothetical protein GCM10010282_51530 [Streptomyces roseolus]
MIHKAMLALMLIAVGAGAAALYICTPKPAAPPGQPHLDPAARPPSLRPRTRQGGFTKKKRSGK